MSDVHPNPHDAESPTRDQWLTNTLYALRFHFNTQPIGLQWPEDVKNNAEALIVHCTDNTLQERQWLAPKGQAYDHAPAGAAIAPKEYKNSDLETKLEVLYGSMASAKTPYPKSLIIIGHEKCKANKVLHDGLLRNADEQKSSALQSMYPMAPQGLKEAIQGAHDRDVDEGDVIPLVEKSTVLQSMKNMYAQSFMHDGKEYKISDLVNDGTFQIIGAMRGRTSPEDKPPLPLSIYDPFNKTFVPAEVLYREAFGREPGEDAVDSIEARKYAAAAPSRPEPGSVVVPKGATSQTRHIFDLRKIDDGLKFILDSIEQLKKTVPVSALEGARL